MKNENKITLLDLSKVDKNIVVTLKKNKLNKIKNLIKIRFGSVREFSKKAECSKYLLYNLLNGYQNTTLINWMKICKVLQLEVHNIIEKVTCMNRPKKGFIMMEDFPIQKNASLASLVGHSFGDGHIGIDNFEYANTCNELFKEVKDNVNKLPINNVKMINNFQPNKAPVIIFPKMVRNILVCCGAPEGNKITTSYYFPKWIKKGNKAIKCAFVGSLLDDEGNISQSKVVRFSMSKRIDLIDNLQIFFKEIKSVLEEIEISNISIKNKGEWNGKNGKTTSLILQIFGFLNFNKLLESIQLNNPNKRTSLQEISKTPKKFRLCRGETKGKIIDLIKNDSLTINEIAEKIGFKFKTISEHLNELESKNLVVRTRCNGSRKSLWRSNKQ